MAAGTGWLAATRRPGTIRATLDGLIVATSLCCIGWAVIPGRWYRAGDASAAAYPLADVLIGGITLLILYETRGPRRRSVAGRTWDHLPYVPFGAALCTGVVAYLGQDGRVDGVLFLLMILMTVLILVRQLLALRDNRRLAEVVDDLRHRAYHDPLTGLPNRALLLDTLERRLAAGRPVALLYVDLDDFKPVNDTHGHEAGDRVLTVIAARLAECAGAAGDLVARLGGDEFALLVPPGAADDVAARIIAAVAVPVPVRRGAVIVGASVGIARHPEYPGRAGTGAGDLMRHADLAMYTAKLRGRNRAITFTAELEPVFPVAA